MNMNIYFAPLEGITGYVFRNEYNRLFSGVDKFYTPFIATKHTGKYSTKDLRDILPANNQNITIVPQLLSNNASDFNYLADKIADMGYTEINLNLGCPSPTVTTKKKGAGFLEYPDELDRMLDEIFKNASYHISVKTRIGVSDPTEFRKLLSIYNRYPISELIIHPRLLESMYNGKPNLDWYSYAYNNSLNNVCYNSDIKTVGDCDKITAMFNNTTSVMIGRGILTDPLLPERIKGDVSKEVSKRDAELEKIRKYHNGVYEAYVDYMSGDKNVLFKMKEIWKYLIENPVFNKDSADNFIEKNLKAIYKCNTVREYNEVVDAIFINAL